MTAAPDYGPKPELRWVGTAKLSVDMAYQRSLETRRSQQLIARIAGEFRWSKFGAVLLAPLPLGAYALLHGQHRVAAARQLGLDQVPGIVIEAPSKEEQASAFVGANRDRVAVTTYALHHALVAAGDARAAAIARVCKAADVEIPRYPIPAANLKPNQTLALGTIGKLLGATAGINGATSEGYVVVALQVLRKSYTDVQGALRAHLIQGLVLYLHTHPAAAAEHVLAALAPLDLFGLEHRIQQRLQNGAATRAAAFAELLGEWVKREEKKAIEAALADKPATRSEIAAARGQTIQGAARVAAARPFNPRALNNRPSGARA